MRLLLCMALLVGTLCSNPGIARAQAPEASTTADDIEELFTQDENAAERRQDQAVKTESAKATAEPKPTKAPGGDVREMSDLVKLSPFDDVAVIQRRFLPKTGRFEVYIAGSGILNDAFFLGLGGQVRAAYYLKEKYALEATYAFVSTSEKEITTDLRTNRGVQTQSFVTSKSYYGLDFRWSPVYGKMAFRNASIVPFDMYFSLGGGMTGTNQAKTEPTLHLGTGQVFAISKGMAFRWDLSWNAFSATSELNNKSSVYNNLLISMGVSFFFPEATYR